MDLTSDRAQASSAPKISAAEGVETCVMTAEHLVAIALRTGRTKDYNRILQFVEQDAVDRGKLQNILQRNGLVSKWQQFERKYLGGSS